jgi:osmotically-inducible protein OsmY
MGRDVWEHGTHGRAPGEQGYGSEYVGRDGHLPASAHEPAHGPKNWVRSDERIRDEICERLAAQEHDWSDVEVHVSDGEATLTGSVRNHDLSFEAERVAAGVSGVKDVTNELRVKTDAQPH